MDVIIQSCFDKFIFYSRNTIRDRQKRQEIVDYLHKIISISNKGRSSQSTAKEAVTCILRYHDIMKETNNSICLMGKFHNVLYVGMKLAFDWQVKDSGTIGTLLEQIYTCEKTFERLFLGAIFGVRAPYFIAGWKSDFLDPEENLRAVVFYLDHACTASLDFQSDTGLLMRMIDVPLENCGYSTPLMVCVQLGLADKVHIFLRFGALLRAGEKDRENVSVVQTIILKLSEFNHKYPFNFVCILQLILRVIPSLTPHLNGMLSCLGDQQQKILLEKYNTLVEDGLIPLRRSGFMTPELKHLCRCEIRKSLWYNHQLPTGIQELHVPESLKRYLDILQD
ncbi:uncharacterized protein LOC123309452 isoform X2 [Coccinella septempunctata]|uniref:uncharacterized protein LOC123309452 isoform X2 n=1 Tax=Coccinella septempunctata TaxID=41139 RepID=UPI001D08B7DF|nr:uncharacterized protein LOC123309452 isoform X2 [Coccinella septempunctata]